MNKHLLVVGPGFLGKEIVREATELGWAVSTLSRSGSSGLKGDVTDLAWLIDLADKIQPTHIIHCASASAGSMDRLESYRRVYLKGSENLVTVFPQSRIVFTSSTSVYAQEDGSVVDESSETKPSTETAKVLLEAEAVITNAGGIVARLSGIYGKGRSYMLKRLRSGDAKLDGEGTRLLNHIHHIDGARACLFLLENAGSGEIYNVTDSITLCQKETYQRLCKTFDIPMPESAPREPSPRGNSDKSISNSKLLALGWKPLYPCFADAAVEL